MVLLRRERPLAHANRHAQAKIVETHRACLRRGAERGWWEKRGAGARVTRDPSVERRARAAVERSRRGA